MTLSLHTGNCDRCKKRHCLIVHLDESTNIYQLNNFDYRFCEDCLRILSTKE